ncbi:MAG: MarR family transcriptional regulator [Pseudomonadota bacterium]
MTTEPENPDLEQALASSTWLAVVRAYQTCAQRYEELMSLHDLSTAQFDCLDAIERLGDEALPKHIAQALLVTRGNVTGLIQRLENAGLNKLQPHPSDGRARLVRMTTSGQALHAQAKRSARGFVKAQLSPFDRSDLDQTHAVMNTMHFHLLGLDVEAIHRSAQLTENHPESLEDDAA